MANSTPITLESRQETLQREYRVELELLERDERNRSEVERFISVIFKRAYNASISHFLPYLLSMREEGKVAAALGLRPADEAPLFLETYLDRPVENVLAECTGRPIDRSRLVEVGNLASAPGGGARALIITLTAYLEGAGYDWVVFTATPRVRNNFAKLGIQLFDLAPADGDRLGKAKRDWGSYYEQQPVVVAGNVADGAARLQQALTAEQLFPTAHQLWEDAHNAGRSGQLWQPPRRLAAQWPAWVRESREPGFEL
ncbi:MAG: thermostable hemolysin [Pseudomonadota bacterium]